MTPNSIFRQAVLCALFAIGAVACSSTVVRESGSGRSGPVAVSKPRPGATVVVRRGDNLYRIATDNGITLHDLAAWNGISPPYTIHPGQRLRLYPSGTGSASVAASGQSTRRPEQASSGSGGRTAAAAPPAAPAAAPVDSGLSWRWPADGELVSRFANGDPTRQGVDIAGRSGAPVRAAGDGVVVYSGAGLVGYGELIIIKHNDQWLSAYGHNRNRLVAEGAVVKSGQQIAEMGRSGAARDMLHFEIRYNGKPVDPLQYLPRR
ncbi:peptidoglycan DD-metalloendopeptidase family protein [Lysobacter sp. TLK-CK17T]|uniref:Peptidoglycan DD-metalloendopeptidase family protein n=2 Tax=Marilutibacter chinensis TaxID=2912247 RepID=A0ABS9HRL7_9GAMM|nr:peptidoglycan DD-metalloendopeptidase family protein [Lysobacter chinensis]MCF7221156.1 peptidoglycan DD-metalloendopeptidase family protein [Lysobacter chinensis]MCF7223103.1 peptidoglycan DD-metalloendopeptidase family protein [Lysobacter chinensis]